MELATSEQVVIAWWGAHQPPSGHLLATAPDIDTIMEPQKAHWTKLLFGPDVRSVVDVYSDTGRCARLGGRDRKVLFI